MLEQVALKKGMTETVPVDASEKKKGGKKTKQVPNVDEAARRVIRDFLNNRLTYHSEI